METLIDIDKIDLPILKILLSDRTTGKNIIWATDSYKHLGSAYERDKQIFPEQIQHTNLIEPRIQKALEVQKERTKKNAEVFTPAWICNQMNNQIDKNWLKDGESFNQETEKGWKTNPEKIDSLGRSEWSRYVKSKVLEITCGEAPFLVSRYDSSTGEKIEVQNRIGLLDRKLRIITERTKSQTAWYDHAKEALRSVYGYEFQGDSLLIGRLNVFLTIKETMQAIWNVELSPKQQKVIAEIISWNLFQMDGLTDNTPIGVPEDQYYQQSLFDFFDIEGFESPKQEQSSVPVEIKWSEKEIIAFKRMKEGTEMVRKFDVVIGNPPYQDNSSTNSRKPPIYNLFMDEANKLSDQVLLITPARFLFNAGQTPKEWNSKMLQDEHFMVLDYEPDGTIVFPGTDIKGGVAIHYHNKMCKYEPIGIFSAFPELNAILKKVNRFNPTPISSVMVGAVPYRYTEKMTMDHPEVKELAGKSYDVRSNALDNLESIVYFAEPKDDTYVGMFGLFNKKRDTLYIKSDYLIKPNNFEKYKVLVPKSNGSGALGEVLSTPLIGQPLIGHTQSFISIGAFDTEAEAKAALKYIKSKFARALLGVLKITQDNPPEKWKYVPLQDFTSNSDIDWSKSIPEIDQQLYKKYGLSSEEIEFIETHVKEME